MDARPPIRSNATRRISTVPPAEAATLDADRSPARTDTASERSRRRPARARVRRGSSTRGAPSRSPSRPPGTRGAHQGGQMPRIMHDIRIREQDDRRLSEGDALAQCPQLSRPTGGLALPLTSCKQEVICAGTAARASAAVPSLEPSSIRKCGIARHSPAPPAMRSPGLWSLLHREPAPRRRRRASGTDGRPQLRRRLPEPAVRNTRYSQMPDDSPQSSTVGVRNRPGPVRQLASNDGGERLCMAVAVIQCRHQRQFFASSSRNLSRYSMAHSSKVSRQSTAKDGDTMVSRRKPGPPGAQRILRVGLQPDHAAESRLIAVRIIFLGQPQLRDEHPGGRFRLSLVGIAPRHVGGRNPVVGQQQVRAPPVSSQWAPTRAASASIYPASS